MSTWSLRSNVPMLIGSPVKKHQSEIGRTCIPEAHSGRVLFFHPILQKPFLLKQVCGIPLVYFVDKSDAQSLIIITRC